MKNYEEKEKKLQNLLKKLNAMSNRVIRMNNSINSLNLEKNQLLREKEESDKNFKKVLKQHEELFVKNNPSYFDKLPFISDLVSKYILLDNDKKVVCLLKCI